MFSKTAIEPLPDMGRKSAKSESSDGTENILNKGERIREKMSAAPEALNIAAAHITARILGNISIPVFKEFLTPYPNAEKAFFLFIRAVSMIKIKKTGIIYFEKSKSLTFLFCYSLI